MSETTVNPAQTVELPAQPQYVVQQGGEQYVPQVPNNLAHSPEASREYAIEAARLDVAQAAAAQERVATEQVEGAAAAAVPAETAQQGTAPVLEKEAFEYIPTKELPLHLLRDGIATGRLRQERLEYQ